MGRRKLNKPVVYVQVKVTPEEKNAFDNWCFANGTTMSDVIRREIDPYIKKGQEMAPQQFS